MNIDNLVIGKIYNCFFRCPIKKEKFCNRYTEYTGDKITPWKSMNSGTEYFEEEVIHVRELNAEQRNQLVLSKLSGDNEILVPKCEAKSCSFIELCTEY